jgi:hypothetical protein
MDDDRAKMHSESFRPLLRVKNELAMALKEHYRVCKATMRDLVRRTELEPSVFDAKLVDEERSSIELQGLTPRLFKGLANAAARKNGLPYPFSVTV